MKESCFVHDCLERVSSVCECKETLTYFCFNHSGTHISENRSRNHSITSLEKKVRDEDQPKILKDLEKFLKDAKYLKAQVIRLVHDICTEADEVLMEINKLYEKLKYLIKSLKGKSSCIIFGEKETLKNQEISHEDFTLYLNELLEGIQDRQFKFFGFNRGSDGDGIIVKIGEINSDLNRYGKNSGDLLFFLRHQKFELTSLNLENFTRECIYLKCMDITSTYNWFLQLNKEDLLIYEGQQQSWFKKDTSRAFIFNLKTLHIKEIPLNNLTFKSKPIFFNEKLLFFTSTTIGHQKNAYLFDLVKESWKKIQCLPYLMKKITSVQIDNKVLIAGKYQSMTRNLFFIPEEDKFEEIESNYKGRHPEVFINFNGNLFIISKNLICSTSQDSFKTWEVIRNKKLLNKKVITTGIFRKNFVYFADKIGSVYRFNCIRRSVTVVSII